MAEVKALDVLKIADAIADVRDLDVTMWCDNGEHYSCTEAVVIADLLEALGLEDAARYLMTGHYYGDTDEETELENHVHDGTRDSRIDPSILWAEGTEPY